MKSYVQIRDKAIFLRKNGASYTEIERELNISRGTLSKWLKKIPLASSQNNELKKRVVVKMARGRMNALVVNKSKRVYREKTIYEGAEKEFQEYVKDPLFVTGISLYLAKGSKNDNAFRFMSFDENMIILMKKWAIKYLGLEEGIVKTRKFGNSTILSISGINNFRKMKAWQKLLIQYYSNVLKF
jgi:hypothetical protein